MRPEPVASGDSLEFAVVQPWAVLCPDADEETSAGESHSASMCAGSDENDSEEGPFRDSFPSKGFRLSLEGVPNEEDEHYFKYNLSEAHLLERVAVIVILQEASDQLTILRTLMKVGVYDLKADWQYKTLKEKYETDLLSDKHQPCTDQGKLYAHTYYLNHLLDAVIGSMLDKSDFRLWQELMDSSARERKEERDLVAENHAHGALLSLVQSRLRSERLKCALLRRENTHHAFVLENDIHDQILNCAIERRHVTGWEAARAHQLELRHSMATSAPLKMIDECARLSAQEAEVTQSIVNLQTELLEQTQTLIDDWLSKFDVDMEAVDLDIMRAKGTMEEKKEELEEVAKEVARRHDTIDTWRKFIAERDLLLEEKARKDKNALIVQCWWRGILVRKALGPFAPKTKGKKGKGKKGKGKKGKGKKK